MEAEHQNRLLALLEKIPHGVPAGWEKETFAVGGLMYIGFSNLQTEKLVVVSSQGQSVINCQTWEKVYCTENWDEEDLIACAEPLGNELVPIAGLGRRAEKIQSVGGRPGPGCPLLAQGTDHLYAPIRLLVSEPRGLHHYF